MNTKNLNSGNTSQKIIFLIGCTCLISIIAMEKFYYSKPLFHEGWPNFTKIYIIRSISIFLSIAAMIWSLINNRNPKLFLSQSNGISIERGSIIFVVIISVIVLFLFISEPLTFNRLSKEDNIVEWGSALLLFGGCFISILCFFIYNYDLKSSKEIRYSFILLSLVFFVIAMEELSWFQRVINIETPKLFENFKICSEETKKIQ